MAAKTPQELFLTEMILTIHNEVQSAVDYLAGVASQGTELGKGTALMGIQNLRVKLPLLMTVEQSTGAIPKAPNVERDVLNALAKRKGFAIDTGSEGKMGLLSKLKVNPNTQPVAVGTAGSSTDSTTAGTQQMGEIEIVFSPIKRE